MIFEKLKVAVIFIYVSKTACNHLVSSLDSKNVRCTYVRDYIQLHRVFCCAESVTDTDRYREEKITDFSSAIDLRDGCL